MGNGRPTNDNTELCYECLLPWIPQLCELDVLEDWGRVHQLHFPSKGGKSRHTTTHNGIQIDCIEDYVVRALGTAQRPPQTADQLAYQPDGALRATNGAI